MLSRLTALFVICVTLGVGAPASICAMGSSAGDCCPTACFPAACESSRRTQLGTGAQAGIDTARCCVAPPTPASSVSTIAARVDPEGPPDTGSSGCVLAGNVPIASVTQRAPAVRAHLLHRHIASRTYLLTARLRL